MAIEIICDDCGNKYRVADDKAGSKVKCRECGARIDVPGGDDDDFETDLEDRSRPRRRGKKSSDGQSKLIMIGLGAVAAIIAFAVVIFSMPGRGGQPNVAQINPPPNIPGAPPMPVGNGAPAPLPSNITPGSGLPSSPTPPPANTLPGSGAAGSLPTTSLPKSTPTTPTSTPGSAPTPGENTPGAPPVAKLPGGKKFGGFAGSDNGGNAGGNDGGGDPAEGRLPATWDVKVDPATVDTKIDSSKAVSMRFPKGASHTDILFPASPSVFMAIGANSSFGPVREVWNLATKAKVGTVTNDFSKGWAISALSPDGQHLAITHFHQKTEGVSVWVTKTGKGLGSLASDSPVTNLLFAGTTHLVGFCKDKTAKVWKMPSGDLEHELNVEEGTEPNTSVPTPGGKYLAVVTSKTSLKMFDLEKGTVAGELALPYENEFGFLKVDSMAFTTDGTQLAMVIPTRGFDKDFLVYDMADGKLVKKVAINVKDIWGLPDNLKSNRLEWFADGNMLLWRGHFILDPKIGGPVWSAPQENGSSDAPRKLLGNDKILIAIGGNISPTLKIAPVPLDEIAASAKTVAQGGEASDAGMPTLSKADVSEVAPIAMAAVANWSMKPDPTSPGGKPVKASIALPRERSSIGGVAIANPSVGKAVVWYTDDMMAINFGKGLGIHNRKPPKTGTGTVTVDVVDLASGKSQSVLDVPYPGHVMDASPDGDAVAVKTTKPNDERIDVYSTTDGAQLAGWKPYHQQEEFHKGITFAKLIDRQHCLTQNFSGTTYMWKLPECKALWKLTAAKNFCLSPGGKYLGFQAESRYVFMDPRTGELVAELPVTMSDIHCAFHFLGTHLAMLSSDGVSRKITVLDVATGKPTADFFAPQGNETVQWCGDTSLLLDGTWLVDLQQQKNAWQYQLGFGTRARTQPDGRHWFVVSSGPLDQNVFLSGLELPEKAAADKIAAAKLPDESLLQPGMQVNLQVNLSATSPNHPNLVTDVTNNFRAGLEKNGFQVAAGGPYTFVITTAQSSDGEPMKFDIIGRLGGDVTVPRIKIDCEVSLLQGGQSVWKHQVPFSNFQGFIHVKEGEDIPTYLSKQMWDRAAAHLTKFPVPAQVFGQTAGAGVGKSMLVPGGTQPAR